MSTKLNLDAFAKMSVLFNGGGGNDLDFAIEAATAKGIAIAKYSGLLEEAQGEGLTLHQWTGAVRVYNTDNE